MSEVRLRDGIYRAKYSVARHRGIAEPSCLSVRPSVCNVEVSWSDRLEFLENNFTAD